MGILRQIEIPPGVNARLEGSVLTVSGPKGTLVRDMRFPQIDVRIADGEVIVSTASDKRRFLAMSGTLEAHVKGMFRGVVEGYEYRMKVVYSHFPIQLKLSGNRLEINNFLGEKKPRYALIRDGVTAKVGNDEIVLSGINRETLGITSANIEDATRIRNRDPRIFQDGIYRIQRG